MWPNLIAVTGLGVHVFRNNEFSKLLLFSVNPPDPPNYGLTWDKKQVVISQGPVLHFYTKEGYFLSPSRRERDGYHQIMIWNGYLYACSTSHDRLDKIDLSTRICVSSANLKPAYSRNKDSSFDWSHINSVFCNGQKIFVVHHNFGEPSYISVLDLDLKPVAKISDIGSQNHNVYVDGAMLYTLSSKTSEIVMVNASTGKQKRVLVPSPTGEITYLRGLAKSKDYFIVGVTHSHGHDQRDSEQSYLTLFDNQMNYLDKKQLPQTGQIREVRIIDEPDYAHNGQVYPI